MVDYKNIIKNPPLPFLGNKRNWMRILHEYYTKHKVPAVVVDVFGGVSSVNARKRLFRPFKNP